MAHRNRSHLKIRLQLMIILILFLTTRLQLTIGVTGEIGVDYGLNGDNLPSPERTVALLKSKGIARVRMYEAKQEITRAFANSGIELLLGIPNDLVPKIAANLAEALNWVTQNVVSFPKSRISAIIVGNEWLLDPAHDPSLLLPAMLNVYTVLTTTQLISLDLTAIKVSTSHALNVLNISFPPSAAQFDSGLLSVLTPILTFLEQTGSFFMVNIFPYFAYVDDSNVSLDFALFEAKEAVRDPKTGLNYTNLFDLQLDAVYAALDRNAAVAVGKSSLGENDNEREQQEDINARGSWGWRTRASTLNKRRREGAGGGDAAPLMQIERRSSSSSTNRRRPRVLVGESGWPSGSGGSGSVPHAQLHGVMPPAFDDVISRRRQPYDRDVVTRAADRAGDVRRPSMSEQVEAAAGTCGKNLSARVCGAATVENARRYNQNLIRHVLQARGTPANPTTAIHAFIFSLFNEDLKPGAGTEQHYGLFFPNAMPVYPITFHL